MAKKTWYRNERHCKVKSFVAERFILYVRYIRFQYWYININLVTVTKYNNIYERTIKVKPVVVKSKTYINFNKENNYEGPKLKVRDYVRISKYKNIFFQKVGFQIGWKKFLLEKLKILRHGHMK